MARLSQAFNTDQAPDRQSFDLIPIGTVATAKIIEASVAEAKSGRGEIISLTWELQDGPHAGRRVWGRINYLHENQKAQDIGQGELKELTKAFGIDHLTDTEDLLFKPAVVTIGIEKSKDANYPDRNKVTKVGPMAGAPVSQARTASPPSPPAPPSTPAARPATGDKPWKTRAA